MILESIYYIGQTVAVLAIIGSLMFVAVQMGVSKILFMSSRPGLPE